MPVDVLRQCDGCGNYRHISEFNVGWRNCWTCESAKRGLMEELGIITADHEYALAEEKIWRFSKQSGKPITRLID